MIVEVRANPRGARCYVAGRRVHHAWVAVVGAICIARGRRAFGTVLVLYGASDWKDFPFRDCDNH